MDKINIEQLGVETTALSNVTGVGVFNEKRAINQLAEKINEMIDYLNIQKNGYPENCRMCGRNHPEIEHTQV